MKRNDNSQKSAHEKKQRIPVWLYPDTLRATCIKNIKKTGGAVTFDAAVKYQRGE